MSGASRRFRAGLYGVEHFANRTLGRLEIALAPRHDRFSWPPVFIIGAPRSGTTLLSQVMVNAFHIGYFANVHRWFYFAPSLLQRYVGWALPDREVAYESRLGFTRGVMGPSECDVFWRRWFPRRPHYVDRVDIERLASLRRVLIALTEAFRAPLLLKSLVSGLRLRPLAALLPEALFIVCRRDPLLNAQSLLLVREAVNGHRRGWWSIGPPQVDELKRLPPEDQVARQISDTYAVIRRDREFIGDKRFLTVDYEAFCRDVHGTLDEVRAFFEGHHVRLTPRFPVPRAFPVRDAIRLGREDHERLSAACRAAGLLVGEAHRPARAP